MWASSQLLEQEAIQDAKDKAEGIRRATLSPAAIKRKLAAKKKAQREARKAKS